MISHLLIITFQLTMILCLGIMLFDIIKLIKGDE